MKVEIETFLSAFFVFNIVLVIIILIFMVFLEVFDNEDVMLDTQTAKGRLICSEYRLDNCGAYCKTNDGLEYSCLTNYRIVN